MESNEELENKIYVICWKGNHDKGYPPSNSYIFNGFFLLPNGICTRLNSLLKNFCWGYLDNSNKINWLDWVMLSRAKHKGGLGFREVRSFDLAMLAKQC